MSAQPRPDANKRLILIMGNGGAGKSTFINLFFDQAPAPVTDRSTGDQNSCTLCHKEYFFQHGNLDVTLVDTIGFNHRVPRARVDEANTQGLPLDDDEAMMDLIEKCRAFSDAGRPVSGLIFLHAISTPRIGNAAIERLEDLDAVIGSDGMKNVVFLTTQWTRPVSRDEIAREANFRTEFVMPSLTGSNQAHFERLDDMSPASRARAMEIIQPILSNPMQNDIKVVAESRNVTGLSETTWGKKVDEKFEKKIKMGERKGWPMKELREARRRFRARQFKFAVDAGLKALDSHGLGEVGVVAGALWGAAGEGFIRYGELWERGDGKLRGMQEQMWKNCGDKAKRYADNLSFVPLIGPLLGSATGVVVGGVENIANGTMAVTKSWVDPST